MEKLRINQWAEEDRPREKLTRLGAAALTNAELLAILIGSGSPDESAVELMKRVLKDCNNNLNTLGKKSVDDFVKNYKGIGPAKAITILAACELGKRRQREEAEVRQDLSTSAKIYDYMRPIMQDLDVEEAWILLMNQHFKLKKAVRLSHGGLTDTSVDVRVAMQHAILENATVMAFCHNHPSGNPNPSRNDDQLTRKIKNACDTMRIYLVDHVIVTDGQYYSYRDNGKL